MNSKLIISEQNIIQFSNKDIQLNLLQNIKSITDETVFKAENKHVLEQVLLSQFSNNNLADNQKREIINIGMQVIKDVIDVSILDRETQILQKINNLNEQNFLKIYSIKLEGLKLQISNNKAKTSELEKKSEKISLNELANNINEYHNPNHSINNINDEVEDLLNGGTLNL